MRVDKLERGDLFEVVKLSKREILCVTSQKEQVEKLPRNVLYEPSKSKIDRLKRIILWAKEHKT